MRLDHVGLAVKDLKTSLAFWEGTLGVKGSIPENVASQGVWVSFLEAGETHIELLQPTSEGSTVAKFIAKRGEGIHHLAFRVSDIQATLNEVKTSGGRLVDEQPRVGAGGRLVAFLHPSSAHGVLTEFVQDST
jgi:methylmalonyl-CoA epimerase